jgi:hypothetical protein
MEREYGFIGWCNEANHDKIWGYFYRPTPDYPKWPFWQQLTKDRGWNVCVFWAARGKAIHFKADTSGAELDKLERSKLKKGYQGISRARLEEIWPTFGEESSEKLLVEILMGKVK